MSVPRVSIIVPCAGDAYHLGETVDSVLAQSFDDVEILVVGVGAADAGTAAILDTFSRSRTRVVRSESLAMPGAKNLGLAQTSGELICVLGAGDLLSPQMLERSVAALDAEPALAFVSHWVRSCGNPPHEWAPSDCDFPGLLDVNTVSAAAVARRAAVEAAGGFDETCHDGYDDWDLWISMVGRGCRGTILPLVLVASRRPAGPSQARHADHPALYRRLVAKHAPPYRAHLATLLARREREEAGLDAQLHDLEIEQYSEVAPQLWSARDDLREYERWLVEARAAAAVHEMRVERDAVLATAEHLAAKQVAADRARQQAHHQYRHARTVARQALEEVDAVRRSWIWRLAWPFRAASQMLRPLKGHR